MLDGAFISATGFIGTALAEIECAEIAVRLGEIGVERDRLLIGRKRLVYSTQFFQSVAEVDMEGGGCGFYFDSFAEERACLGEATRCPRMKPNPSKLSACPASCTIARRYNVSASRRRPARWHWTAAAKWASAKREVCSRFEGDERYRKSPIRNSTIGATSTDYKEERGRRAACEPS